MTQDYLRSEKADAAIVFLSESELGMKSRPRGPVGMLKNQLGRTMHRWMWDYKAMYVELEQVGFRKIRRAEIGDETDAPFADVEDPVRWSGALAMACLK